MIKDEENASKTSENVQKKKIVENIKEIILNDENLNDDYKKIISKISDSSLSDMKESFQNYNKVSYMELFDILSTCIIFLENIKLNKIKLKGETKKNLVLFISEFFIKKYINDELFLKLYDEYADDIIEKIIYNSVFLNVSNLTQNKCCNIF